MEFIDNGYSGTNFERPQVQKLIELVVIPYNSIIDQTISVFEKLFEEDAEILRHQSTFSYEEEDYAAVSYTHLDVYKRQILDVALG